MPATYNYVWCPHRKKTAGEHRLVWEKHNGPIPEGMDIDHINGDRRDNRIENLRLATRTQNLANGTKRKPGKSGFLGVCQRYNKWAAKISHGNRTLNLGYFSTPKAAARAYDAMARYLHGEFAMTNERLGLYG